jgi:hypothetical protein
MALLHESPVDIEAPNPFNNQATLMDFGAVI